MAHANCSKGRSAASYAWIPPIILVITHQLIMRNVCSMWMTRSISLRVRSISSRNMYILGKCVLLLRENRYDLCSTGIHTFYLWCHCDCSCLAVMTAACVLAFLMRMFIVVLAMAKIGRPSRNPSLVTVCVYVSMRSNAFRAPTGVEVKREMYDLRGPIMY